MKIKAGNRYIIIDKIDKDLLSKSKKYRGNNQYAGSLYKKIAKRMFGDIPKGMEIDHKNRNKYDNSRSNLRVATKSQNHTNSEKRMGKLKLRGVRMKKGRSNFEATINQNGKKIYIGVFDTKERAALAYNKKARELYGEFAYQNTVSKSS